MQINSTAFYPFKMDVKLEAYIPLKAWNLSRFLNWFSGTFHFPFGHQHGINVLYVLSKFLNAQPKNPNSALHQIQSEEEKYRNMKNCTNTAKTFHHLSILSSSVSTFQSQQFYEDLYKCLHWSLTWSPRRSRQSSCLYLHHLQMLWS